MENLNRKKYFENIKRVVIKIGSSSLTVNQGLNVDFIKSISRQINNLIEKGIEIILVSSGAMASGLKKIGLLKRPDEIPKRQAVAAVGQAGLIMEYEKAFSQYDRKVAQILLTSEDLSNRKRYLNARNTLYTLLSWKIIPVINENDTVATEEIKFGDNDNLAAMITILMEADLLINLTDIDGLYNKDPRNYSDAELIYNVSVINKGIEKIASGIAGSLGTGGMLTKIKAAKKVTIAGIPMVIAKSQKENVLFDILAGEKTGTFFLPENKKLTSRKCWIAFNVKIKGKIIVDNGAAFALVEKGTSLLSSGIVSVNGKFDVGAAVELKSIDNKNLGIGLVNYNSSDIIKIMGIKSNQIGEKLGYKPYDEVIHRDNLVINGECKL